MSGASPELTIVIPTRDRAETLEHTLELLNETATELPVELVVVDDGSTDATAGLLTARSAAGGLAMTVVRQPESRGPAAARNIGIERAAGTACLFIGDDLWPEPELVPRHLEYHRLHPAPEAALLGRVVPAPPLDRSEFVVWLHEEGVQFGYAHLEDGTEISPTCFWTSNVSAKTALLRDAGGFDERFAGAACEDAELGLRLARRGMRLRYDAGALGRHYHPTDLPRTIERMRGIGHAFRTLGALAPELPMPRRPGPRHRVKAVALGAAARLFPRARPVRNRTWRFICDEVQREAFWGWEPTPAGGPRIGAGLVDLVEPG